MTNCSTIITTTDNESIAKKISEILIKESLASCVQQDKVTSTYMWEGKLVTGQEYRLMIHCSDKKVAAIEKSIKKHHNYKLPQIIQVKISGGEKEYMEWLNGGL